MKTLGERIADLRRERGITQENLAGIIGVSAQAISKWENNATMPDIMLLPIIADTLGVTIDELFGIRRKVQEKPINCEETPMAVYDQILNTMWRSGGTNEEKADLFPHWMANGKRFHARRVRGSRVEYEIVED